jgi:hypothetical protein
LNVPIADRAAPNTTTSRLLMFVSSQNESSKHRT